LIGGDYDKFENQTFIERFRGGFLGATPDISTLNPEDFLLLDVIDPVFGQFDTPVPGPNTDREEELDGFGFYIQDQIDITEQFQIRLGLRWDDFTQDLTDLRATPATTDTSKDSRVSPQFGAVYRINEGFSLYASYGEGFRQQTGSTLAGTQPAPNLTESAEIGFKVDLGQHYDGVSGNVTFTAFEVDQDNFLVNDDRPEATAAGFFTISAGEARSRGIEFDANVVFDSGTNIWLSYAYTDAEFRTTSLDENFGSQIEAGDPLINSPEHQVNLQISQNFNVANVPAQVGGGLLYVDQRAGFTGFDFSLPSYTTVRLFGQVEPIDGLSIRADIDNLFNETFYTNSFADVWVQPGAPRRWRVTASYAF